VEELFKSLWFYGIVAATQGRLFEWIFFREADSISFK
jgi:hypothetical protein